MSKFFTPNDVNISDQVVVNIADHEVLLSFNDDAHGYAFNDWWDSEGIKSFEKWCDENY